jgi:hypothetical protein
LAHKNSNPQQPKTTSQEEEAIQPELTENDKKFLTPEIETAVESAIRVLLRVRKMTEAERNEPDRK